MQRRGKGHGAEREREKLEGEGGGGAEETPGGSPLPVQHCPKGSSPQGKSEAITKSELHSPKEQRDLVIVRSDQQKTAKFAKKPLFFVPHKEISGSGVFANFNGPGLVFGQSKFPEHHRPYGNGKPP